MKSRITKGKNWLGETLDNGATVIVQHEDLVLCHWRSGSYLEFATWQIDEKGSCYWGHYTDDLSRAIADLRTRVKECSSGH